jgi:hypothetical protein
MIVNASGRCICGEQATTGGCATYGCPNGPVRFFVSGEVVPVPTVITPLEPESWPWPKED